jgi:hypothetical protein
MHAAGAGLPRATMPRLEELSHPLLGDAPTLQLMTPPTDIPGLSCHFIWSGHSSQCLFLDCSAEELSKHNHFCDSWSISGVHPAVGMLLMHCKLSAKGFSITGSASCPFRRLPAAA